MKMFAALSAMALTVVVGLWDLPASAQTPVGAPLSQDQVDGGHVSFDLNCADCHGKNLSGGNGPALVGKTFVSHWANRTAQELYEYIRTTMPVCSGGILSARAYLEITAYLLWANGANPGKNDLAADTKAGIGDFTGGEPRPAFSGK
jgi:mono/diheme cytochrome c family protein